MIDEEKLKGVMAEILEIEPSEIHEDSSMDTIESWESIRHMNLILAVEEEFGVSIPDDEAADLTSYALLRLVLNELTGKK